MKKVKPPRFFSESFCIYRRQLVFMKSSRFYRMGFVSRNRMSIGCLIADRKGLYLQKPLTDFFHFYLI